jgi:hypothetical protein
MENAEKNILVVVGVQVPTDGLARVARVLQAYYEMHRDRFTQKIVLQRSNVPDVFSAYLPIRTIGDESDDFWLNNFKEHLARHKVDLWRPNASEAGPA